jgi:hypothetical protein
MATMKHTTPIRLASRHHERMRRVRGKWFVSVDESFAKLNRKLEVLALVVASCGRPEGEPFADLMAPSREALARLAPEEAGEWGLALVRAIFRQRHVPGAVTAAAKAVGNAARQLKHMAAREAAPPTVEERYAA